MQRTFPDPSESPWTQPETGLIYEYVDGMWRPQDPSGGGGGGSSGGGSSNLDLGGMIIAHHVISSVYPSGEETAGNAWTRTSGSTNKALRHRIDLFGWDTTDYDTMFQGPSYEVVTAPDKRTILSRYAIYGNMWLDNTDTTQGPCTGWAQKYHGKANVEGNFLFTWYLSSPWLVQLSDEEILNIINSYLDDPSPYQLKGPRRVNIE